MTIACLRHACQATGYAALLYLSAFSGTTLARGCPVPSTSNIFNVTLCARDDPEVGWEIANYSGNRIESLVDLFDEAALQAQFADYDKNRDQLQFQIDLRGLPAIAAYPDTNGGTRLIFDVPILGIHREFIGATRDGSNDLFEDYLKEDGDDILKALLQYSVVEPLAGNPNSVQSEMIQGDFEAGMSPGYDTLGPGGTFGAALRVGRYSLGNFESTTYTLPLSYTYVFKNQDKLILRLPLTYSEVEGADVYRFSFGASYRKNLSDRWSLTPSLSYGAVGSSDLGSAGHILSASLTSDLMLYHNAKVQISMGNLVGVTKALPVKYGDYSVDYDFTNTVFKNGFIFSVPLQKRIMGMRISTDFFIVDTRFLGDDLFIDNFQEIGFSFGPTRSTDKLNPNVANNPIGIGLKYTHAAKDVSGISLTVGYKF